MTLSETRPPVQRFRFASFDAEDPDVLLKKAKAAQAEIQVVPEIEIAPPAPTFSEEELATAKQAAYKEGFAAGVQDTEAKQNKEAAANAHTLNSLLDVIATRITLASEEHIQFLKSQKEITAKLTLAIARKIAGEALKRDPLSPLTSLLDECARLIEGQTRIVVAVPAARYGGVQQSVNMLKSRLNNFQGEIEIQSDSTLAEYDCRVEWKNGAASRNFEALWNDIETLLAKTTLTS